MSSPDFFQHHHRYITDTSHPVAESRTGRILSAIDRFSSEPHRTQQREVALKFVFVPNSENNGLAHSQLRETAVWGMISAYAEVKEEQERELSSSPSPSSVPIPILKLRDVFSSGASVVYVSQRMKTDLHSFLNNSVISLDLAKHILRRVLVGLDFLHRECNVLHRDLKPANLFLDWDEETNIPNNRQIDVFIGDFGLARSCAEIENLQHHDEGADDDDCIGTTRPMTHEVVSRAYRAPELLLGCGRALASNPFAIDMWSVGCIAIDLLLAVGKRRNSPSSSSSSSSASSSCSSLAPSIFAASSGSDLEQLGKIYDLIGTPSPHLVVQRKLNQMMCKANSGGTTLLSSSSSSSTSTSKASSFISFNPRNPMFDGKWGEEIAKHYIFSPHTDDGARQRSLFGDFVQRLLCNDPSERMSAQQCLAHRFLSAPGEIASAPNSTNEREEVKAYRRTPWFMINGASEGNKMEEYLKS